MSEPRADPLAALRRFGTPTIANALESLGLEPDTGISDGRLSLLTMGLHPFVGRAVTARISTARPSPDDPKPSTTEAWWRYVAAHRSPAVVVVEDVDEQPQGAMWGEVQGRLHLALGVSGIVTNGAARDIDELTAIGLPVLGGKVSVSHAYARFLEFDTTVRVDGLDVAPGDLLHADRHGVQRIPAWVDLEVLVTTSERIEALERELFAAAGSMVGLESFLLVWRSVRERWPAVPSAASPADVV